MKQIILIIALVLIFENNSYAQSSGNQRDVDYGVHMNCFHNGDYYAEIGVNGVCPQYVPMIIRNQPDQSRNIKRVQYSHLKTSEGSGLIHELILLEHDPNEEECLLTMSPSY